MKGGTVEPLLLGAVAIGAAILSNTKPPLFDNVEYNHIVELTVMVTNVIHDCDQKELNLDPIKFKIDLLNEYETHLTKSENKLEAVKEIKLLLKSFSSKENYSVKYCKHKFSEIQATSRTLARAIGGLHKFDICDSDFSERVLLYKDSLDKKLINQDEYEDLINDIKRLEKTDQSSCSEDNKIKLNQGLSLISNFSGIFQFF